MRNNQLRLQRRAGIILGSVRRKNPARANKGDAKVGGGQRWAGEEEVVGGGEKISERHHVNMVAECWEADRHRVRVAEERV